MTVDDPAVRSTASRALPRQRRSLSLHALHRGAGAPAVAAVPSPRGEEVGPLRSLRRVVLCHLGVHTSVHTWGADRGTWCDHCRTLTARA